MSQRMARQCTSAGIAIVLGLQSLIAFKIPCPPKAIESLSHLRVCCPPTLWPFLDYNTYVAPHYEGEVVNRTVVVGIPQKGKPITLRSRDLGISQRQLREKFVPAVRRGNRESVRTMLRHFDKQKRRAPLNSIQLENWPLKVSSDKEVLASRRMGRRLELESAPSPTSLETAGY